MVVRPSGNDVGFPVTMRALASRLPSNATYWATFSGMRTVGVPPL